MRKYLTATEAADILRITPERTHILCREGKLEAYRPHGKWLIPEDAIDRYVKGAPTTTDAA
jgi:excisionase family DNA binding protein